MNTHEPEAIAILRAIIEGGDDVLTDAIERGRRYLRALPPTLRWIGTCDLDLIVEMTAEAHGLKPAELLEPRRFHRLAHARQLGMWVARDVTEAPLEKVAHAFGMKDHGTVSWALCATQERIDTDPHFAAQARQLREAIALAIHKRRERAAKKL